MRHKFLSALATILILLQCTSCEVLNPFQATACYEVAAYSEYGTPPEKIRCLTDVEFLYCSLNGYSRVWTFGDGDSLEESGGQTNILTHNYYKPATYSTSLSVNNNLVEDYSEQEIEVLPWYNIYNMSRISDDSITIELYRNLNVQEEGQFGIFSSGYSLPVQIYTRRSGYDKWWADDYSSIIRECWIDGAWTYPYSGYETKSDSLKLTISGIESSKPYLIDIRGSYYILVTPEVMEVVEGNAPSVPF